MPAINIADFFPIKEAATRAVKKALDEAGIGIPFPQMDVHMDPAASAAPMVRPFGNLEMRFAANAAAATVKKKPALAGARADWNRGTKR